MRHAGSLSRRATALALLALLAGCASAPEVDKSEMLARSSQREAESSVFVSPVAHERVYKLVAVMPFRAPVDLAGASISDLFATAILKTYKYRLIERGQMEQVLGEQALGLKGVTDSALAVQVGKILRVQGVIVGTVPEYGSKASGSKELAAVGINVRMIDVTDGSIVWSISDSAVSDGPVSISSFSRRMVDSMVARLAEEWRRAGDTMAVNLAAPQILSAQGRIRGTALEIRADASTGYTEFIVQRSQSEAGPWEDVGRLPGGRSARFEEAGLLDAETYYYQVVGRAKSGYTSLPAGPVKVVTAGPPPPVAGLRASGQVRRIELGWEVSTDPNVTGYQVSRKNEGGGWSQPASVEGRERTVYAEDGLQDSRTYTYRVAAFNGAMLTSAPASVTVVTKGPPAAVTGVRAASGLIRRVDLAWDACPDTDVQGYQIERRAEGGSWSAVDSVEGRSHTSYKDEGLKDGKTYEYRVSSANKAKVASAPATASAVTKGPPSPVRSVEAVGGQPRKVTIRWSPVDEPEVKGYAILRAEDEAGSFKQIAAVTGRGATQWVDAGKKVEVSDDEDAPAAPRNPGTGGLADQKRYFYRVRAVNVVDVKSADSPTASAVTKPVPAAVGGLTATGGQVRQVALAWASSPEVDIARYEVFRGDGADSTKKQLQSVPAPSTAGLDKELQPGTIYFYRVRAVDRDGLVGTFSAPASATTKPLPRQPQGLRAAFASGVSLSWQPNPESDIARYVVYKKAFFGWDRVGEATGPSYVFAGEAKSGKTLTFRISAQDAAGQEGDTSAEAAVTIP